MNRAAVILSGIVFSLCFAAAGNVAARSAEAPAFTADASAGAVLAACRGMLPVRPITLKGAIVMRSRKGIVLREYDYELTSDRTQKTPIVDVKFTERGKTEVIEKRRLSGAGSIPQGRILKTDVTWLDLTLDFLWWPDASFEAEREGETVHGQSCTVIIAKPPKPTAGVSAVRLWVDRKTGCLMQAEQLDAEMKAIRRLWGTRVKKFGERWMANVLEVETLGARHRTKITVESIEE